MMAARCQGRLRRFTLSSAVVARCLCSSSTSVAAFTVHRSFAELIPQYDAFILDQFGASVTADRVRCRYSMRSIYPLFLPSCCTSFDDASFVARQASCTTAPKACRVPSNASPN
jgi:hypothetical protein